MFIRFVSMKNGVVLYWCCSILVEFLSDYALTPYLYVPMVFTYRLNYSQSGIPFQLNYDSSAETEFLELQLKDNEIVRFSELWNDFSFGKFLS